MKKTLLELLKAELLGEHPPEGWYTITELMAKTGAGRTAIKTLIARKKWESRKFRTNTPDGRSLNAQHFYTGKL
jgi:hypothetical protein